MPYRMDGCCSTAVRRSRSISQSCSAQSKVKIDLPRSKRFVDGVTPSVRYIPPDPLTKWPPVETWSDDLWRSWLRQHDWTDQCGFNHCTRRAIDQYLFHDRYVYGFGVRPDGTLGGVADLDDEDVQWLYRPSPMGVLLHACPTPNLMFGGAAGGTKSHSARWEVIKRCWLGEDYRALIIRRELEELKRSHWDKLEREIRTICKAVDDPKAIKMTTQPALVTFTRTNAKIVGGHAHNLGDEERYLSEDYDLSYMDEATRLHEQQIVGIAGRIRNDPKLNRVGRMILTTNPGGPAHGWCVRHFIEKNVTRSENPKYDADDYVFIPARLHDNPFYVDPDGSFLSYEKRLAAYAPARRKQLMDGDWSAVVGQFFEDFDKNKHVRRETIPERCHLEVWLRSGAGGRAAYACFVACLPDGRLHIFAELLSEHLVLAQFAALIARTMADTILPTTKGRWLKSIGDSALFPTSRDDYGESPAETCRRAGLYLVQGDDHDVFGWERLKHWWGTQPITNQPWLTIDPDCVFAIRTLPTVTQDDTLPDTVSEGSETQAAHALRIGVMARPSPSPIPAAMRALDPHAIKHQIDNETGARTTGRPFGMIS